MNFVRQAHPSRVSKSRFMLSVAIALTVGQFSCLSMAAPLSDSTYSVLSDLFVSPLSIDVSSGSANVSVRAHITDNLSGFSWGQLGFSNPAINGWDFAYFSDGNRVSGNALDGWYETNVSIAQYSAQGTYSPTTGYLIDNANNFLSLGSQNLDSYGAGFTVQSSEVPEPPIIALILIAGIMGAVTQRKRKPVAKPT